MIHFRSIYSFAYSRMGITGVERGTRERQYWPYSLVYSPSLCRVDHLSPCSCQDVSFLACSQDRLQYVVSDLLFISLSSY